MKKTIRTVLFIGWLIMIYSFSAQDGNVSLSISDGILYTSGRFLSCFVDLDIYTFVRNNGYLIRKAAHFAEYFILWFLAYGCFKEYGIKRPDVIGILFCIFWAFFDEFHQLFVAGRSGQMIDCLIDSSASFCAFLLWHIKKKRSNER
ncbi:MAG: VanZ family protein [Erysipelotrichaceae bacterium]|nr:VanZ family protein [Erysipelotrichaceae bacterium]